MTREEALKDLALLLSVPLNDIKNLMNLAKKRDFEGCRRLVKRIRRRQAKIGF